MVKYKLHKNHIQNNETGGFIPVDTNNRHYQEYLKWGEDPENIPDIEETLEPVLDPRIAMIDDCKSIIDIKNVLKQLFGLSGGE